MVPDPASAPATTISGAAGSGSPPCSSGTPQRVTRSTRSKSGPFRSPVSLCSTPAPEAIRRMIVHHAHGLHERVADRRAHELESPRLQVLAHELASRDPTGLRPRRERLSADERPDITVEAPELLLRREEGLGVCDDAIDLETVPDDALVLHEHGLLRGAVSR